MKFNKIIPAIAAAIVFAHCVSAPKVVDVQAAKARPQGERELIFKSNAITPGGFFTPYKVGETGYPAEGLSPLFDGVYVGPDAKEKYSSGTTFSTVGAIFGAAGGGMLGFNLGRSLAGGEVISALWIAGSASTVLAIVFAAVADGKFIDASKMYNNDLQKGLDLQQKTSAVKPQEQFTHYTLALNHSL